MTIEEAIETLQEGRVPLYMSKPIQLGIEGLERLNKVRDMSPEVGRDLAYLACLELLPSETKE